jgi:hypothetical protein
VEYTVAFDVMNFQLNRIVSLNDVEYRVIEETTSGLLLVAKEEDIKLGSYPLQIFAITEPE